MAEKKTVRVPDYTKDAHRMFVPRVMTRSAVREEREARRKFVDMQESVPDSELDMTEEVEEQAMRVMCDYISTRVAPAKDGTEAGDLLYEGWLEEKVTEEQIYDLLFEVAPEMKAAAHALEAGERVPVVGEGPT